LSDRVVRFPGAGTPEAAVSDDLVGAVEAILFAAGGPVRLEELCEALEGVTPDDVSRALEVVSWRCGAPDRGIELAAVAGGWQLRTKASFASVVLRHRGGKPTKLSRAALEVLSVVAYRQPCTRPEVEAVRGVDSGGAMKSLLEKGLVRVAGRREEPGRPLEYGTTDLFLQLFQLPSIAALPTLREREELLRDRSSEE
jgi:segregation and condensation protein B